MEITEIKKSIYKQNPKAILMYIRKGNCLYETVLLEGEKMHFSIPISDMGDADFFSEMDAKYLIRWLTNQK